MPAAIAPQPNFEGRVCVTNKDGELKYATVLERQNGQVYVHYTDQDKRLDEWVDEVDCTPIDNIPEEGDSNSRKRKRRSPFSSRPSSYSEDFQEDDPPVTGEDLDIKQHKQITAQRNFETVHFGNYQIKTWYFSPYPLTDEEELSQQSITQGPKIAGVARATARSHGRTSDLLAGGLHRYTNDGHRADLYVCDLCFKYMAEPSSWEAHKKGCTLKHPPGRKVYERGPRAIWEVDGAQQKLYCQNLSLFGKLFIDVKTLFFDCDNFLFYILTEGTSIHTMLGFFSKEKISYDDYNLACIMTLPPKQRQGYGTLMIEFSYELSRRAGKVGTPERPLSDLGLRGYLQFWVSHIVRFFRQVLTALPSDFERIRTVGNLPDLTKNPPGELPEPLSKKRKRGKSGDGDDPGAYVPFTDLMFTVNRVFETVQREDGVAEIHVSVQCTLADIARATDLRIEDTAFALNECGLLMRRFTEGDENETIIITREIVEKAAAELRVRSPWLRRDCILLDDPEK